MSKTEGDPRRLVHFTPLRYPGGKGKLAAYIKEIIRANKLYDGEYVEPYAGGAAIGLELLFQEYVTKIHINDLSRPVYSFWKAVLNDTDELCRRVKNTRLTVAARDRQKRIFMNQKEYNYVDVGFATFFLNRTNRSGILNGGVIGGRDQTGPWKIDARYNAAELIFRIESIAKLRSKIKLTRNDALALLRQGLPRWPKKTLIYLDPPYYERGRDLYYDYYRPDDHAKLATFIEAKMGSRSWVVSYDNVAPIRKLYRGFRSVVYNVSYTARENRTGKEVMFFSPHLDIPALVGPVKQIGRIREAA
ncbi:MAG: DNA adenine methylase [Dongiaceae bacterium]